MVAARRQRTREESAVPTGGSAVRGERRHATAPGTLPTLAECLVAVDAQHPRFTGELLFDAVAGEAVQNLRDAGDVLHHLVQHHAASVEGMDSSAAVADTCALELVATFAATAAEHARDAASHAFAEHTDRARTRVQQARLYLRIAVDVLARVST